MRALTYIPVVQQPHKHRPLVPGKPPPSVVRYACRFSGFARASAANKFPSTSRTVTDGRDRRSFIGY